jgi:predicted dehydrogenase
MNRIRTAAIGVGFQGRRQAQKLARLENSELLAVVDADAATAQAVADELGVGALTDPALLPDDVEAVIVATPASTHFEITTALLERGIHVLLEKPIATSMEEARALVELAERTGLVFQVGHLERFNPVVAAMARQVTRPEFVESNRIAPYKPRALDVSVVMDLMIHDIDLIHSVVGSPMASVDAVGRTVFSESIDVANARIRFDNGCVANVTSSRISLKTERSMRIFAADSYISADLHNKVLTHYKKRGSGPVAGPEDVDIDTQSFGESDAMLDQARAFLESVAGGPPPLVSGRAAMEALETAMVIGDLVQGQQRQ